MPTFDRRHLGRRCRGVEDLACLARHQQMRCSRPSFVYSLPSSSKLLLRSQSKQAANRSPEANLPMDYSLPLSLTLIKPHTPLSCSLCATTNLSCQAGLPTTDKTMGIIKNGPSLMSCFPGWQLFYSLSFVRKDLWVPA